MARRSLDETRTLLLDTAAAMVAESGVDVTVGKLDLTEVSRHAGLATAGSAYKIWESQEDFRVDLLYRILESAPGDTAIGQIIQALDEDPDGLPPLPELIRSAVDLTTSGWVGEADDYSVYIALWLAAGHDPVLRQRLHDGDRALIDPIAALYERLVGIYGLEWVAPMDARLFATLVSSLSEGLSVQLHAQPDIVKRTYWRHVEGAGTGATGDGPDNDRADDASELADPDADQPWSLLACAVLSLVQTWTRPAGSCPPVGSEA